MKAYPDSQVELLQSCESLFIGYQNVGDVGDLGAHATNYDHVIDAGAALAHATDRCQKWRAERERKRNLAKQRLNAKLLDPRPDRRHRTKAQVGRKKALGKIVAGIVQRPDDLTAFRELISAPAAIPCSVRNRSPAIKAFLLNEAKLNEGEWDCPPWEDEPWFQNSRLAMCQQVHMAELDPTMIAYTQSVDKLRRNIQTKIKPGRYLKKYFGDVLTDAEIKVWADKVAALAQGPELLFVDNDDPKWKDIPDALGEAWRDVYRDGPHSCMKKSKSVAVYGMPGNHLALAYWVENDIILARTIVRNDTKEWVRVYYEGKHYSTEYFQNKIKAAGYTSGTLDGIKIRAIESGSSYLMPYLDDNMCVNHYYDHFKICDGGEYSCQNTDGYLNVGVECDCCGGRVDEEAINCVESDEARVCDRCFNNHYTYAHGRRYQDYFRNEDVVVCESNGEWYVGQYASNHGVYRCPDCGVWYHGDDLFMVHGGDCVCEGCCVTLDEDDSEGNDYARKSETVTLEDGRVVHESNADDFRPEPDEGGKIMPIIPPVDTTPNFGLEI